MKVNELNSNQIVTLNDFPVHHEQCLKIYFRIFQKGHGVIVPPCPVINKSIGVPFIHHKGKKIKQYNQALTHFLETHPQVEYFLLDGSHRTTAATLCYKKIPVLIFESDIDITQAEKLVARGELFSLTTGKTIKEIIKVLQQHFLKTLKFETVAEKTERMVKKRILPKYMIDMYSKSHH